jgi:hypothetical protein
MNDEVRETASSGSRGSLRESADRGCFSVGKSLITNIQLDIWTQGGTPFFESFSNIKFIANTPLTKPDRSDTLITLHWT